MKVVINSTTRSKDSILFARKCNLQTKFTTTHSIQKSTSNTCLYNTKTQFLSRKKKETLVHFLQYPSNKNVSKLVQPCIVAIDCHK